MAQTLTAIVLTFNEAKHIRRCLRSLAGLASSVLIVDCGSMDHTREIAAEFGARVLVNPWTNYACQFNWALDHGSIATDWCLRIDADEYLSEALRQHIAAFLACPQPQSDLTGLTVRRTLIFLGRPLRWGAMGDAYMLRLFRTEAGRCEDRWMDEHITLRVGRSARIAGELFDENLNNIGWWVNKHNGYATREAIDLLQRHYGGARQTPAAAAGLHTQARVKRFFKYGVYARVPPGIRSIFYFLYRYVVRLGMLDGRAGLAFCVMQALWYRMLVDLKVLEIEARMRTAGKSLDQAVFEEYGVRLDAARGGGSTR
jgi:glycosyltransferase involved in cell wall biosynthesis